MVDMLNDVFELIAEKYSGKIKNIAESDKITAVARKTDLEQGTANASKVKQFKNYKGKEHSVDGEIYLVNAGYNREGCIKQIERMLILCDENQDVFKITKEPEKSTRRISHIIHAPVIVKSAVEQFQTTTCHCKFCRSSMPQCCRTLFQYLHS